MIIFSTMKTHKLLSCVCVGLNLFAFNAFCAESLSSTPDALRDSSDASQSAETSQAASDTGRPRFEIWSGSLAHFSTAIMGGTVNLQASLLGSSLGTGLLVGIPNPSVGYFLDSRWEATFTPSFNILLPQKSYEARPTDGTTVVSRLTLGIVYNFSENVRKSNYLRFENGLALFKGAEQTVVYYVASLHYGLRYELTPYLSYVPTLSVEYIPGAFPNSTVAFTLTLLQVALYLN